MSSSYPLITTKIRIPRRGQTLLRRARLVNYLHNNIQHKLILVAAAAGYGKTSLLVDYAHDTDLPVCWYRLDANDADVLTFVDYLVASIRQTFPQFGDSIREMLRTRSGPPEAVEPFVRLLVHEIQSSINRYFVIILDDYHEVIASEPVNALLDGLLRYLPEQCHLILASRGVPRRLTLTSLAAQQEVVGLGVEHLRFSADEIRALLQSLGKTGLTHEQTRTLAERSEGWITGILLAAQANWTGTTQDVLQITGATGGVFEYMAAEILGRQPPALQSFLLRSALFTEMTPPLCDALLEIHNAAQLLQDLATQNLFTSPLDTEGMWYQYHQLFREFLVSKLERDDPEGYRRLRLKQAGLMAERGHWARAIDSYIAAQAFTQAADTMEIVVTETFDAGSWGVLKGWIDALSQPELGRHPRLLLFRAKIYAETGMLNPAAEMLEHSYQAYLQREDPIGAARALVQSAIVQRFRGRLRDTIETCQKSLAMAADRDPLTAIQAHRNIGIAYTMQGQSGEGVRELESALQLAERHGDEINAAQIAHDIGTAETLRGQLVKARQYYHRALIYWRKIGNASTLASTLQCLGVIHHYLGQYAEADSRFQEAVHKARDVADARITAYTLASQGDLYRDTGRYDEALEIYGQALEIASNAQLTHLIVYIRDAQGNAYRLKGHLSQASQLFTEVRDQVREGEMDYEVGLCDLSLGVLALQRGDWGGAYERLDHARELFTKTGYTRDLARAHLHLAALAYAQQNVHEVRAHWVTVAKLAGELGSQQFIVGEGPSIAGLLHLAEEQGLAELDYPRLYAELILTVPAAPANAPAPLSKSMPTLEFLGLNGGQILKNGRVVTEWESVSARMMAFLFIAHPAGLRRDQVIDLLWPDVAPAKGNSLFHSTLYRLRSALFKDIVVPENGVYRLNPACSLHYDVAEFSQWAKQGRGEDETAHTARLQAIELYHAPFLETCEDTWCYEIRQTLHDEMLNLLLSEADCLAKAELNQEAESYYTRALSLDSFDERAHRGIMRCRASRNDRTGAVRQFRECSRILQEDLDVKPSTETLALYDAILSGKSGLLHL
jgi:LuxR family transcriptional regulator, maltose regulon positive regulatory protein